MRPGVCNALECLLVHQARRQAPSCPRSRRWPREKGVELRGCAAHRALVPSAEPASPADYGREFLDKILAVRVVDDIDDALAHVAATARTTPRPSPRESYEHAQRWLREVDASCVLVNASTRFNDGGELGLGAEIGISTSKLHAFGPMGLESLTAKKWIVYGDGQVRG